MKKELSDIDFVIPWVDGSDPAWIAEFNKYCPEDKRIVDVSSKRYRDYGLLKYWFRGVEQFAPWVRKVHFITCGQKPEWLNLSAPKLHWVRHSDYIPQEYLPVFSSHPIELMMHKIPGLAEQIVYFNDDLFLTSPVRKKFFFRKGLPCDSAILTVPCTNQQVMPHILLNDLYEINRNFHKGRVMVKNPTKWFHPQYGKNLLRTLLLLPWPNFPDFQNPHMACPYLKPQLEEVWEHCQQSLENTMKSRFRSTGDVNQYLFRFWRLCKGEFTPTSPTNGKKYFELSGDITSIVKAIEQGRYKEIVLNDAPCIDFEKRMQMIATAFEHLLPEKSTFEL